MTTGWMHVCAFKKRERWFPRGVSCTFCGMRAPVSQRRRTIVRRFR